MITIDSLHPYFTGQCALPKVVLNIHTIELPLLLPPGSQVNPQMGIQPTPKTSSTLNIPQITENAKITLHQLQKCSLCTSL
jgi:hypothetical protein